MPLLKVRTLSMDLLLNIIINEIKDKIKVINVYKYEKIFNSLIRTLLLLYVSIEKILASIIKFTSQIFRFSDVGYLKRLRANVNIRNKYKKN
ncbi:MULTISPECIES: hypothetical protein [Clostridium]|uniref:Uncharacterized protein n=1 Tax=Clostridium tertium TaxID=1559 RepID=A0A9X4AZT7_9CLOT|nr:MULTISPECIES: hypothetical protein [Clostridium]MDC4240189.1 hypothetical protein [Clostridium tertium]